MVDAIADRNDAVNKAGICIPVVSAIIERVVNGVVEILVQTRYNLKYELEYSGTLEIPAGWIDKYENVYDALRREVFEETGLRVTKIFPDEKTTMYSPKEDGAFAFIPFCCQQQTKGGKPWIGFVLICEVEEGIIRDSDENNNTRWIKKSELKELFDKDKKSIFTLQLGVLDYYLKNR